MESYNSNNDKPKISLNRKKECGTDTEIILPDWQC